MACGHGHPRARSRTRLDGNACLPLQGLVAVTDVATDVSQRPDPAGQSFCRSVVWADRHPGTGGKALPLPDLTLQEAPCLFLGCELCVLGRRAGGAAF